MDLITISIIVFWGLALWIISGLKGLARRRNAILLFPEEK